MALPAQTICFPVKRNESPQFLKSNRKETFTSFQARYTQKPNRKGYEALKLSKHVNYPESETDFLDHALHEQEQKLKRLKHNFCALGEGQSQEGLVVIDMIQSLGLDHHFQNEIEELLRKHYFKSHYCQDLQEIALSFRLLRQQGYYVFPSVFEKSKNNNGMFHVEISAEKKGLMELYDASYLSIQGEDILDEARDFSAKHLEACVQNLDTYEKRLVRTTLDCPKHRSLPRLTAKSRFLTADSRIGNQWVKPLQQAAKTEVLMAQFLYHEETSQILKWWRELGLVDEIKFARNQPLKWYKWSMAILADPKLSEERVQLTKPVSFIYIIDDIFDVWGHLNQLILFTEMVERWSYEGMDQLPDFMKSCFRALDNVTNDISLKIYKKHGWNPVGSLRRSWATLCNAFLVEARWFASGYIPSSEEYLKNGIVSCGMHVALAHVFFLLGEDINQESEHQLDNDLSEIVSSTATILRLWDDLGSAKDEDQDAYDGSFLECYLNEHKGSNSDEARQEVLGMISNSWKSLNKACLFRKPSTYSFTRACLDAARTVPLQYSYNKKSHATYLEDHLESLFFENYI